MNVLSFLLLFVTFSHVGLSQSQGAAKKALATSYKDISHFGLAEFVQMDFDMIGHFSTQEDWNNISESIKAVPVDLLRYIDSLDVVKLADSLFVKIYTQNYAYQSQNTYTIISNPKGTTDSLTMVYMQVELKMKDDVDDLETFRRKNYRVDYILKQNSGEADKRMVINKIYQE
jgi:hypothetical protein